MKMLWLALFDAGAASAMTTEPVSTPAPRWKTQRAAGEPAAALLNARERIRTSMGVASQGILSTTASLHPEQHRAIRRNQTHALRRSARGVSGASSRCSSPVAVQT